MFSLRQARKIGFTLIELLIVVAIIAILAAIAVPNFLEAQTRSKISRLKSDMRSGASGVEAYTVDWGRPPFGGQETSPRRWAWQWLPRFQSPVAAPNIECTSTARGRCGCPRAVV